MRAPLRIDDETTAASRGEVTAGLFLRLSGQLDNPYWHRLSEDVNGHGADLYYNVRRWYELGTGRYGSVDRHHGARQLYGYALGDPLRYIDPLGLYTIDCSCGEFGCSPTSSAAPLSPLQIIELRVGLDYRCSKLSLTADVSLIECFDVGCKHRIIKCEKGGDCHWDPVRQAYNPGRLGSSATNSTAVLCSDRLPASDPPSSFAGLIFHEWAYGCGRERYDDHDPSWDPWVQPGR